MMGKARKNKAEEEVSGPRRSTFFGKRNSERADDPIKESTPHSAHHMTSYKKKMDAPRSSGPRGVPSASGPLPLSAPLPYDDEYLPPTAPSSPDMDVIVLTNSIPKPERYDIPPSSLFEHPPSNPYNNPCVSPFNHHSIGRPGDEDMDQTTVSNLTESISPRDREKHLTTDDYYAVYSPSVQIPDAQESATCRYTVIEKVLGMMEEACNHNESQKERDFKAAEDWTVPLYEQGDVGEYIRRNQLRQESSLPADGILGNSQRQPGDPDRSDRHDRPDGPDRPDRPERADPADRADRADRSDRVDRADRQIQNDDSAESPEEQSRPPHENIEIVLGAKTTLNNSVKISEGIDSEHDGLLFRRRNMVSTEKEEEKKEEKPDEEIQPNNLSSSYVAEDRDAVYKRVFGAGTNEVDTMKDTIITSVGVTPLERIDEQSSEERSQESSELKDSRVKEDKKKGSKKRVEKDVPVQKRRTIIPSFVKRFSRNSKRKGSESSSNKSLPKASATGPPVTHPPAKVRPNPNRSRSPRQMAGTPGNRGVVGSGESDRVRIPGLAGPDRFMRPDELLGDEVLEDLSEKERKRAMYEAKESMIAERGDIDKVHTHAGVRPVQAKAKSEPQMEVRSPSPSQGQSRSQSRSQSQSHSESLNHAQDQERNRVFRASSSGKIEQTVSLTRSISDAKTSEDIIEDLSDVPPTANERTSSPKTPDQKEVKPNKPTKPLWKATVDPSTGNTYYYHRQTRQTTWEKPPDFDLQETSKKGSSKKAKEAARKQPREEAIEKQPKEEVTETQPKEVVQKQSKVETEIQPQEDATNNEQPEDEVTNQQAQEESTNKEVSQQHPEENQYESKMENGEVQKVEDFQDDQNENEVIIDESPDMTPEDDPAVEKTNNEIRALLKSVSLPDGADIEKLLLDYKGRETLLLRQLQDLLQSKPFDEPLQTPGMSPTSMDESELGKSTFSAASSQRTSDSASSPKKTVPFVRTGVSANTRVSEMTGSTRKIKNTSAGKKKDDASESKDKWLVSALSTATSISSAAEDVLNDSNENPELANQVVVDYEGGAIPSKLPVPRSRDLKVEEFPCDRLGDRISKEFYGDLHETGSPVQALPPITNQDNIMTPELVMQPSLRSDDDDSYNGDYDDTVDSHSDTFSERNTTDSISALSETDVEFAAQKESFERARRKALDSAVEREDWGLAAALSEGIRQVKDTFYSNMAESNEWTQTELDRFISENDWDAVGKYIADMREDKKNNDENSGVSRGVSDVLGSKNYYPGVASSPGAVKIEPRRVNRSSHPPPTMAQKRFGARSQLQHGEIQSVSSWDGTSSFDSDEITSGTFDSSAYMDTTYPHRRFQT